MAKFGDSLKVLRSSSRILHTETCNSVLHRHLFGVQKAGKFYTKQTCPSFLHKLGKFG